MDDDPDTVIDGRVYQRMQEYPENWSGYVNRYYVRSTNEGRGYMFMPDSITEYLTGDTAALAGDTVHDVLVWNSVVQCATGLVFHNYALYDVVVDSVRWFNHLGVSVYRQYLHLPCQVGVSDFFPPSSFFWQAGMGTSGGACLHRRSSFDERILNCACIQNVNVFLYDNIFDNIVGWPGGPACCSLAIGIMETSTLTKPMATPNPSAGLFKVGTDESASIEVFDPLGRPVIRTAGATIDLSKDPPGTYVARLTSKKSRSFVRLVVQR